MSGWVWRRRFLWAAFGVGAVLLVPVVKERPILLLPLACLAVAAVWVATEGWRRRRRGNA